MGGKDVVYVKQQYSSPLQPADVQKRLKDVADKRFSDVSGQSSVHPEKVYGREMVCSVALHSCPPSFSVKRIHSLGGLCGNMNDC